MAFPEGDACPGNEENWAIVIRMLILVLEYLTLAIVLKDQEFSEDAIREVLMFVFGRTGKAATVTGASDGLGPLRTNT